jgi:hypothetical protein
VDGDAGRRALACASGASTGAMARLATTQPHAAGSLHVADMPTVPEQVVSADRW